LPVCYVCLFLRLAVEFLAPGINYDYSIKHPADQKEISLCDDVAGHGEALEQHH
jgi:hypothetical protein